VATVKARWAASEREVRRRPAVHLCHGRVRPLPSDDLDGLRDVARDHVGVSRPGDDARRPAIRALRPADAL